MFEDIEKYMYGLKDDKGEIVQGGIDNNITIIENKREELKELKEKQRNEIRPIVINELEEEIKEKENNLKDIEKTSANAILKIQKEINKQKNDILEGFKKQYNALNESRNKIEKESKDAKKKVDSIKLMTSKERSQRLENEKERIDKILRRSELYDTPEVYKRKKRIVAQSLERFEDEDKEVQYYQSKYENVIKSVEEKETEMKELREQYLINSQKLNNYEDNLKKYADTLGIEDKLMQVRNEIYKDPKADPTKVDPTKVDPTKVDSTKVDSTKVDSTKAEPTKVDSTKVDPTKAEPTKAEPTKAEPTKAEPTKAEPTKADPTKAEPKKAEPTKAEPKKAEPTKADPTKVDPKKAEPTKADPTPTDPVNISDKYNVKIDAYKGVIEYKEKMLSEDNSRIVSYGDEKDLKEIFDNKKDIKKELKKVLKEKKLKYKGNVIRNANSAVVSILLENNVDLLINYLNNIAGKENKLSFNYDVDIEGHTLDDKTFKKLNKSLLKDNKKLGTNFPAVEYLGLKKFLNGLPFLAEATRNWIGKLPKSRLVSEENYSKDQKDQHRYTEAYDKRNERKKEIEEIYNSAKANYEKALSEGNKEDMKKYKDLMQKNNPGPAGTTNDYKEFVKSLKSEDSAPKKADPKIGKEVDPKTGKVKDDFKVYDWDKVKEVHATKSGRDLGSR